MDLRVATNDPPSAERHLYSLGDHLRVRRVCHRHHGINVGADRVVQFGDVLTDKPHSGIDEMGLHEFHRGDLVEIVPKQQNWLGLWDLPPALPPGEIVSRAPWLADRRSKARTTWSAETMRRPRSGACATWARASSHSGSRRRMPISAQSSVWSTPISTDGRASPLGDERDPRIPGCPSGTAGHLLPSQRPPRSGPSPVPHRTHGSRARTTDSVSQRRRAGCTAWPGGWLTLGSSTSANARLLLTRRATQIPGRFERGPAPDRSRLLQRRADSAATRPR